MKMHEAQGESSGGEQRVQGRALGNACMEMRKETKEEQPEQQSGIQQRVTQNRGKRLEEPEVTTGSATQRSERMRPEEAPVGPRGAVLLVFW